MPEADVDPLRFPGKVPLKVLGDRPPNLETPWQYFRTDLTPKGNVSVHGEIWDAVSQAPVAAGQAVEVVDVDGLLPVVQRAACTDVPPDLEQSLGAIDAVLLQASGDGDTTRVSGFVRVPD